MILVPSQGIKSWRQLLADPEKHWREGYCAHALATSWEAARGFWSALCELPGLASDCERSLRYQLVHRTASALIQAKRFHARKAALVVHSFSTQQDGFADFQAFVRQLEGGAVESGRLDPLGQRDGVELFVGRAVAAVR